MVKRKSHTYARGTAGEHHENEQIGRIKKILDSMERHNKKEIRKIKK